MRIRRAWLMGVLALSSFAGAGCESNFDPESYVTGLRIFAIKAEPPELPPGGGSHMIRLEAFVTDTFGRPLTFTWAACVLAPVVGQSPTNRDCIEMPTAPFLIPLGSGTPLENVMIPPVMAADLGRPDATGGVYLPLRLSLAAAATPMAMLPADSLTAIYALRLPGLAPNHNPRLPEVRFSFGPDFVSDEVLDPAMPPLVKKGQRIRLRATLDPADQEAYSVDVGDGTKRQATEQLRVSWFSTAGTFSEDVTRIDRPVTEWRPERFLPPATGGSEPLTIYIWAIVRDERGGVDYVQRTLRLEL